MLIRVTQKDIKKGVRGNCTLCPIALAIQRLVGLIAVVDGATVHLPFLGWECHLPGITRAKLRLFDKGMGMLPFSFEFMGYPDLDADSDLGMELYWVNIQKGDLRKQEERNALQTA